MSRGLSSSSDGRVAGRGVAALWSDAAEHERALDLLDGLGDLDATGAGIGAVEGGAAAPYTLGVGQDLQPLLRSLVARVEDEPVGIDDGGRSDVGIVGPVDR